MKHYLITGGAGFIGANLIQHLLKTTDAILVNLDLLTYAGSMENLSSVKNNARHIFVQGDIADKKLADDLFARYHFDGVYHLAAESHVDNSIASPEAFVRTNVLGTFTLLDAARRHWMEKPFTPKKGCEQNRFLHVSTDEVYGTLGSTGYFTEQSPYSPNSPYSASKASSDLLVKSYFHTYGMNVVVTNCSNNYGPFQHDEKLIPTIIRTALQGKSIPVYGDGMNVRDWLFVLDHCKGLQASFEKGKAGETYNIGGNNEYPNIELVKKICTLLDKKSSKKSGSYLDQITYVTDRPGHDRRYAIDATKIKNELGWMPEKSFENGIEETVDFFVGRFKK